MIIQCSLIYANPQTTIMSCFRFIIDWPWLPEAKMKKAMRTRSRESLWNSFRIQIHIFVI